MSRTRAAVGLPVLTLLTFAVLVGCSGHVSGDPAGSPVATRAVALPPPPPESPAALALREWDARRAAAYSSGSVPDLRLLYVAGSAAARADVHLLRSYVARGLVVTDMRMQVLALEVLDSHPGELRLRVTDRLVGAFARGALRTFPLPRDAPSTRELTLRRDGGEWLMAAVRPSRR